MRVKEEVFNEYEREKVTGKIEKQKEGKKRMIKGVVG